MPLKLLFFSFLFIANSVVVGQELNEGHRNARAMGMGNAFSAIAVNTEAIFYNPAGLARSGYYWTIIDPALGVSGLDSITNLQGLTSSSGFADTLAAMAGKRTWIGGGAKSAATFGYLGFAVYDDFSLSIGVDNAVNPSMEISLINDLGYAIALGFPLLPTIHLGASIKRITRTGSRKGFGADIIGDIAQGAASPDTLINEIQKTGLGYSMDLAMNVTLPTPIRPVLSFIWRNVGNTKFTSTKTGGTAPPTDEDEMIFAAALEIDAPGITLTPAFEYRHLNNAAVPLAKKVHLGVELSLPLLDLRAGFHQGYYTLGAGLSLGLMQLDLATWGTEMGAYSGQIEDRRYLIQMTLELGFDGGFDILGDGSKNGGGSARRRLKQRR